MAKLKNEEIAPDAIQDFYDKFVEFELAQGVHEIALGGVHVWSAQRDVIFRRLLSAEKLVDGFQKDHEKAALGVRVRNFLLHNPLWRAPPSKTLIVRWARLVREGGRLSDPISAPIAQAVSDAVSFDARVDEPAPRLYSLHAVYFLAKLLARIVPAAIDPASLDRIDRLETAITSHFGGKYPLRSEWLRFAREFRWRVRLLEALFRRMGVKEIFVVVAYFNQAVIAAGQNVSARVIELQHGLIYPSHTGYDFPEGLRPAYRPDEIRVFGEFWKDAARHDKRTTLKVGGAPHIRLALEAAVSSGPELRDGAVLFISQPAISRQLAAFAIAFARLPGAPKVIYRLHPGDDRKTIAELVEGAGLSPDRFELSTGGGGPATLALQRRARFQVGVFSTALVEGLALGADTVLVPLPGWSALAHLIDGGYAVMAADPQALATIVAGSAPSPNPPSMDAFFARGPEAQAALV